MNASVKDPASEPPHSPFDDHHALIASFRERGAYMLPSGAIVGAPGQVTEDFRRRAYGWIAGTLDIAIERKGT